MCNKLVQMGFVPGAKAEMEKKENTWVDESLLRTWGQPASASIRDMDGRCRLCGEDVGLNETAKVGERMRVRYMHEQCWSHNWETHWHVLSGG